MTTIERMRRFAMDHILRCGSDTEARRHAEVLEQRCLRCHRVLTLRACADENLDQILLTYARGEPGAT